MDVQRIDAVLLDLDRTLVDVESEVDYCAALADLRQAGFARGDELGAATSWGSCTRQVIDLLLGLQDRSSWRHADDLVVPHEMAGAGRARAMPGLAELMAAVARFPVAIVTLLSAPATDVVVERHALPVDAVVARSFEVRAKPHPDQVLAALDLLGVEARVAVMVGDSERDEVAALAAGVAFVGLTNGRAAHRFAATTPTARGLRTVAELLG